MVVFLVAALVGLTVIIAMRYSIAAAARVTVADVPRILEQLRAAGEPTFAVLTLNVPGVELGTVDLQLAMDGGRPGFDWVLCGATNEAEEEHFLSFARAEGYVPELLELNDVRYHRIVEGDLARLCTLIVTKMYSRPINEPLELLAEGFAWPQRTSKAFEGQTRRQ